MNNMETFYIYILLGIGLVGIGLIQIFLGAIIFCAGVRLIP